MSEFLNFDRQYILSAGQAGKTGFEIGEKSKEQPVPLHIHFSIEKSDLETSNTGKISIWNINKAHVSELYKEDCLVSLKAGYGNKLPLIFSGAVSSVKNSVDGADEVTEIEVVDSLIPVRDSYVCLSYNGSINWKRIFDDTADQMGVAISYSYNASFIEIPNGFSFVGPAANVIDKGCKCCNLSWSIQNGVLQIKKPNDSMSQEGYVLSSDTGLIGTPEYVKISEDKDGKGTQYGWDVKFLLNGAINVNDFVFLKSKEANGYYVVSTISYEGDNISGDWLCSARLLEAKK